MPAAQAEPGRGYRRFWFWCGATLAVIAVGLPVGLQLTYAVIRVSARRQVAQARAEIRSRGEPLRLSDALPKLKPSERNAADLYEQAFRMAPDPKGKPSFTVGVEPLTPQQLAVAGRFVAGNRRYLSLLEQASRLPTAAFHANWEDGADVQMPHLAKLREGARALALQAAVQASRGELDAALNSCAAIYRMGDHAAQTPLLIGYLASAALHGVASQAAQRVLSAGDPSPGTMQALAERLGRISSVEALARTLRGERANLLTTIDLAAQRKGPDDLLKKLAPESRERSAELYWNWQRLSYLTAMEGEITPLDRPYAQARALLKANEERTEHLPTYRAVLAKMAVPRVSVALATAGRDAARVATARIALAICTYHRAHGRYPGSLAEAEKETGKLPLDPFVRKPYRYRQEARGFTVWGVGPDLTDNRGTPYDPKVQKGLESPGYDDVFRCVR